MVTYQLQTERYCHMKTKDITKKNNKQICLPFSADEYMTIINDHFVFRKAIDERINLYPELFPPQITEGYTFHDSRLSKKQNLDIRRIKIAEDKFSIRPSFLLFAKKMLFSAHCSIPKIVWLPP